MIPTPEPVPVPRKPPVKPIGKRPHERDLEQPGNQLPLWQNAQQLLERCRSLPRPTIARPNHLHRLDIRPRRNPRKPLPHSWSLRRNYLEVMAAVPPGQQLHHPAAHLAVAIVDYGVPAAGLTNARRYRLVSVLTGDRKPDYRYRHRPTRCSASMNVQLTSILRS